MNKVGMSTLAVLLLGLLAASLFAAGSASAQAPVVQPVSSPVIIATPTPTPSPTPPPTPTPSPTPVPNISLDYSEVSQTIEGSETVVVLHVTATYNFGEPITYDYQNFVLHIRTPRGGLEPFPIYYLTDSVKPFETGSVTVGSGNTHADFTLTFRFSTMQNSFGGSIHFAYYELIYNSDTIATTTPEPTFSPTPTASPTPTPTATPMPTVTSQPIDVGAPIALDVQQTIIIVLAISVVTLLAITIMTVLHYRKSRHIYYNQGAYPPRGP